MRKIVSLSIVGFAIALSACGDDERPTVTVAAASDVRLAFEEMEPQFEKACDCDLVFSFGSSGTLATQIEEGIPVDAFFSANESFVDGLDEQGLIISETKQLYGIGRIVLATPAVASPLNSLDQLTSSDIQRIALANPEHAPYGLAGKEALQAAGVWDDVESKLVLGENASAATAFVQSGDADAGIVPLSLAIQDEDKLTYILIDDGLHNPLRQSAAAIKDAGEAELGLDFIEFVNGAGRETMRKYGFVLPGEPVP